MRSRVLCPVCNERMMSTRSRYTACRPCVRILDREVRDPRSRRLLLAGIILLFILVTIAAILLATTVQKGQS